MGRIIAIGDIYIEGFISLPVFYLEKIQIQSRIGKGFYWVWQPQKMRRDKMTDQGFNFKKQQFRPNMTFENFIVGPGNLFAHYAVLTV